MKCKLSDICSFRKGKVEVENLNAKNYISTENMLPNKCGITEASSLPTVSLTQDIIAVMSLFLIFALISKKFGKPNMMAVVQTMY